ncbi:MAG: 16S rRNA (adenine(1518)-N(6)/adenine(1519)-N(6))-dimethyltransferase RsmA [Pseudodesulfovibrio sp.]
MNMHREPDGHRAKKSLGQNFLQDDNICRKIVDALDIGPADRIIEIGPGQGALTRFIADAAPGRFTAVEKDDSLADLLEAGFPSVEVVRQDALKYPWAELTEAQPCKIVGNLPYNIGSKLIWDIVSTATGMERAVFMVQHEVALRLTAAPGGKAYGGLTAWVKNFCAPRYLFKVPPTVFRPRPKVDSAVVLFIPLPPDSRPEHPEKLSRLLKLLFQQRRKQISTILRKEWSAGTEQWFADQGLDPRLRPENLSPEQLRALSVVF